MGQSFLAAFALVVLGCGADPLTTSTYTGSAAYSGAASGAEAIDVTVFGFPEYCNFPQGSCGGAPLTITIGACTVHGHVLSISEDHGNLEGFTAAVNPTEPCTLGPDTITTTTGTLTSTFSTLSLSVAGNTADNAFFAWDFTGTSV